MDDDSLKKVIQAVAGGERTIEQACDDLRNLFWENIDYAHIDHHRSLRKGFPEVIFGQGKTAGQIIGIMDRMIHQESIILVTRLNATKSTEILERWPDAQYHADARMLIWGQPKPGAQTRKSILVLSAGTSDLPVAKEAALTAEAMGNPVETIIDVGVAGIHRLMHYRQKIAKASVLIVVAGMEGALPSVVAGLVDRPVIAVPTSIGYGANFGGVAALLAMLNSCSSNVAVVNIDNGFGAGYLASMINHN
jgi:NCAIR mutase (PurE)-related protein